MEANDSIDIVIPWVNPNDSEWQKQFLFWKEKETGEKGDCRFRDMDTFNYWFRAVEKNCPWCRYIFLILASKSQIPAWLNIDHPKLKIVYHDEFIPKNELPTFNSSVINCYLPFISELGERYVLFNDDFFAVKHIKKESFFNSGMPVGRYVDDSNNNRKDYWSNNLRNGYRMYTKCTGDKICYRPDHGAIPFLKSVNLFVWKKTKSDMTDALSDSKFRKAKNITDWYFWGFHHILKKVYPGTCITQYYNCVTDFNSEKAVYCFNDNERLDTNEKFESFKSAVTKYLSKKFPDKSEFEK